MKKIIGLGILLISSILYSQVGINTKTPGSTLTVNGSLASDYKIVTSDTTLGIMDYYVAYNGSVAGTITLPAAAAVGAGNFKGRIYQIKNTSNAVLTVKANGSELIDGNTDVSSIVVPIGYYIELISKGTTSGSTWELSMLVSSTISSITPISNSFSIAKGTTPSGSAIFNVNDLGSSIVPGSSSTFNLVTAKPLFINFALGIDDFTTVAAAYPYFRCEVFLDNAPTGIFQIVQQQGVGNQLQFNVSGVLNVSAGNHNIDARLIRWTNIGATSGSNQAFGTLSSVLSAVYMN